MERRADCLHIVWCWHAGSWRSRCWHGRFWLGEGQFQWCFPASTATCNFGASHPAPGCFHSSIRVRGELHHAPWCICMVEQKRKVWTGDPPSRSSRRVGGRWSETKQATHQLRSSCLRSWCATTHKCASFRSVEQDPAMHQRLYQKFSRLWVAYGRGTSHSAQVERDTQFFKLQPLQFVFEVLFCICSAFVFYTPGGFPFEFLLSVHLCFQGRKQRELWSTAKASASRNSASTRKRPNILFKWVTLLSTLASILFVWKKTSSARFLVAFSNTSFPLLKQVIFTFHISQLPWLRTLHGVLTLFWLS